MRGRKGLCSSPGSCVVVRVSPWVAGPDLDAKKVSSSPDVGKRESQIDSLSLEVTTM